MSILIVNKHNHFKNLRFKIDRVKQCASWEWAPFCRCTCVLHLCNYFIDKRGMQAPRSVTEDILALIGCANRRSALYAGHLCPVSGDFPLSIDGETRFPASSLEYKLSGMRTSNIFGPADIQSGIQRCVCMTVTRWLYCFTFISIDCFIEECDIPLQRHTIIAKHVYCDTLNYLVLKWGLRRNLNKPHTSRRNVMRAPLSVALGEPKLAFFFLLYDNILNTQKNMILSLKTFLFTTKTLIEDKQEGKMSSIICDLISLRNVGRHEIWSVEGVQSISL